MDSEQERNEVRITGFRLSNARCFRGERHFRIRPLTLLIGENNTGKTTALGCMQAFANILDAGSHRGAVNSLGFNQDPDRPDLLSNIESFVGQGRKDGFRVGLELLMGRNRKPVHIVSDFGRSADQSRLFVKKVCYEFETGAVEFIHDPENDSFAGIKPDTKSNRLMIHSQSSDLFSNPLRLDDDRTNIPKENLKALIDLIRIVRVDYGLLNAEVSDDEIISGSDSLFLQDIGFNVESISPGRARYGRVSDTFEDIDALSKVDVQTQFTELFRTKPCEWPCIQKILEDFGKSSGMYEQLIVKSDAEEPDEEFEMTLKVRGGRQVKLNDVGYGVSQVLSTMAQVLGSLDVPGRTLLMQQPELNLHPKGQAWLMTQLMEISKEYQHNFIIETHSDYMLDRLRIEIMRKNIDAEDVSLVYLEPEGDKVAVHNIEFDHCANMINAPGSYRAFFRKETKSLFGIED